MPKFLGKRLLVEGKKDLRTLPFLMESNGVDWPKGRKPVVIEDLGGSTITRDEASAFIKESGLRSLGIILDADEDAVAAWKSVKSWFQGWFQDMPDMIPEHGYISSVNRDGIRLGTWIMPDNQSSGMLESFLKLLVRDQDRALWNFAEKVSNEAKTNFNAPFKHVHADKARMHTYLAWQDEPGPQLHEAIDHKVIDPNSTHSQPFVAWFRSLYEI